MQIGVLLDVADVLLDVDGHRRGAGAVHQSCNKLYRAIILMGGGDVAALRDQQHIHVWRSRRGQLAFRRDEAATAVDTADCRQMTSAG